MTANPTEVTIAHSPDSDDAFMFYALANQKLDVRDLKIRQVMKDIETLNQEAREGRYEVSAISFAGYPRIAHQYMLMPCGSSMGEKYGPIVVAPRPLSDRELRQATIAIPGKSTTAYLILRIFQPDLSVVEMPFDQILHAVATGIVDAGLIIHEGQLAYTSMGLTRVVDLGQWWWDLTNLPLPLGGNIIRKDLDPELARRLTSVVQQSIVYSLEHRREALDYALTFASNTPRDLADRFVGMYVNRLTVDCGETGKAAIRKLFQVAHEKGLLENEVIPEFVS